jgi:hypothetical protein
VKEESRRLFRYLGRFVGVSMRGKVSSILLPRNCFLEVTWLPEVLEMSSEGDAKLVSMRE